MTRTILIAMAIFFSSNAWAARLPPPQNFPVGKPTLECVAAAARHHDVPLALLLGVNSVEMGNTNQNVGNKNGSLDTGAFQINSIHFAEAATYGATHADLASRGCYNAQYAAMLLSRALNHPTQQHKDYYTRAAGYHSWTPRYNKIYRKKLIRYTRQWEAWLSDLGILDHTNQNGLGQPQTILTSTPYNPWRQP